MKHQLIEKVSVFVMEAMVKACLQSCRRPDHLAEFAKFQTIPAMNNAKRIKKKLILD